jgi:hypothetical protein
MATHGPVDHTDIRLSVPAAVTPICRLLRPGQEWGCGTIPPGPSHRM